LKPYYEHAGITIYHGDCREILPQLDVAVDSIITDPPYPAEFLPLYRDLWKACDGSLRQGGTVFAMVGQMYLPQVIESYPSSWQYLWCGCFEQRQMNGAIWPRGISTGWKPLLIHGKDFSKFKPWKYDVIPSRGDFRPQHAEHPWGQAECQFRTLMARFDVSGKVLDPLMGNGTTLCAAKDLHLEAIGIEIEEKYCEIAVKRLSQEVFDFGKI
jgi:site-specific DNA-methyltransferase (adenine-specific)